MLSLLETGRALYVLMGICAFGILVRIMARSLYRRLIKESANLATAKNKGLKELKQRAENAYHINRGMRDSASWIEHQMVELRFCGMTLSGWSNFSQQLTWLCLLVGGAGAFFSYWYQLDTYYVVMYGGGAVLMAMMTMLFDGCVSLVRREQLTAVLQDYLENTLFPRLERFSERSSLERGTVAERANAFVRGSVSESGNAQERGAKAERTGVFGRSRSSENVVDMDFGMKAADAAEKSPVNVSSFTELQGARASEDLPGPSLLSAKRQLRRVKHRESASAEVIKEQTAASADLSEDLEDERSGPGKNWLKELGPEDAKVIGDILKQYLT